MLLKSDQRKVQQLLEQAIPVVCKNGLEFQSEFSIEAVIGITLDQHEMIHFSIRDTYRLDHHDDEKEVKQEFTDSPSHVGQTTDVLSSPGHKRQQKNNGVDQLLYRKMINQDYVEVVNVSNNSNSGKMSSLHRHTNSQSPNTNRCRGYSQENLIGQPQVLVGVNSFEPNKNDHNILSKNRLDHDNKSAENKQMLKPFNPRKRRKRHSFDENALPEFETKSRKDSTSESTEQNLLGVTDMPCAETDSNLHCNSTQRIDETMESNRRGFRSKFTSLEPMAGVTDMPCAETDDSNLFHYNLTHRINDTAGNNWRGFGSKFSSLEAMDEPAHTTDALKAESSTNAVANSSIPDLSVVKVEPEDDVIFSREITQNYVPEADYQECGYAHTLKQHVNKTVNNSKNKAADTQRHAGNSSLMRSPASWISGIHSCGKSDSRLRLRPWLESMINSGEIPGLEWLDEEGTMFRIPWKHKLNREWAPDDFKIFQEWARHTGRFCEGVDEPNYATWKIRLRCAFNKAPDIREEKHLTDLDCKDPYRVYKLL